MSTKKKNPERSPRETILDAGQIKTPDDAPDPEVKEEFDEAQHQSPSGSRRLVERVSSSDPQSPDLTDGALDAAWDGSDVDEESPDGSAPSPDQNVVDELGKQAGLTFNDDEPSMRPRRPPSATAIAGNSTRRRPRISTSGSRSLRPFRSPRSSDRNPG